MLKVIVGQQCKYTYAREVWVSSELVIPFIGEKVTCENQVPSYCAQWLKADIRTLVLIKGAINGTS